MTNHPTDKEFSAELESKILAKAIELFMSIGVRNTTMDDLARELGVSKKTLYRVISNKADLVRICVERDIMKKETEVKEIQQQSEDVLEEMLKIGASVTNSLRTFQVSVIHDLMKFYPESWAIIEDHKNRFIRSVVHKNIVEGIKAGFYRADIQADVIINFFIQGTDICMNSQLYINEQYNYSSVYKEFLIYHIRGIATDKGIERLTQLTPKINL